MLRKGFWVILAVLSVGAPSPAQRLGPQRGVDIARTRGGVVASVSPAASLVGRNVLIRGGNAIDSAVATAFALAVTWPEAGNLGGGGFMMIANGDQPDVACIDYRETAPARCSATSFTNQIDHHDARMVGVPGTVRGLSLAHSRYGHLPWADLVRPAVRLAQEGFVVDEHLAKSLNRVLNAVKSDTPKQHAELIRVYGHPEDRDWHVGDIIRLPDLAATLQRIADNGPDAFYLGATARRIAKFMTDNSGFVTAADLSNYRAVERTAIRTDFGGLTIFGPPPPSSGGITLAMILNQLEASPFRLAGDAQRDLGDTTTVPLVQQTNASKAAWTVDQVHWVAEAMRRAFRERAAHLGDADFVAIPDELTSKPFAKRLAATISPDRATDSRDLAGDIPLSALPYESPNTTHFSVVDKNGITVSNTYTLEWSWGSRLIAPGTGVVLNNEMGDFNWFPGYTNLSGKIGTKANLVAPGKRMLSSMTPVIVKRDGKVVLATGSPGGRTIINTVACVLLQRFVLQRTLAEAVSAPRFHHQWLPDELRIEAEDGPEFERMMKQLEAMGHAVRVNPVPQGSVHSIEIDPDTGVRTGVSDWRRGGRVEVAD